MTKRKLRIESEHPRIEPILSNNKRRIHDHYHAVNFRNAICQIEYHTREQFWDFIDHLWKSYEYKPIAIGYLLFEEFAGPRAGSEVLIMNALGMKAWDYEEAKQKLEEYESNFYGQFEGSNQ